MPIGSPTFLLTCPPASAFQLPNCQPFFLLSAPCSLPPALQICSYLRLQLGGAGSRQEVSALLLREACLPLAAVDAHLSRLIQDNVLPNEQASAQVAAGSAHCQLSWLGGLGPSQPAALQPAMLCGARPLQSP